MNYKIMELAKPEEEHVKIAVELLQEEWGNPSYWKKEVKWYLSRNYSFLISYKDDKKEPYGILLFRFFPASINIGYLVVRRKIRSKGIGSALVKAVIDKLFGNKETEYVFVDTRDAVEFFLKNKFAIVKGLTLTLPDEPPEYLAIFTKTRRKFIESKFIRQLLRLWISEIYTEEELEKFREYFGLIFWNVDYIGKICKGKLPLTQDPFMRGVVSSQTCQKIPIAELREQILEALDRC